MDEIKGKTIKQIYTIQDYSSYSIPETRPVLEMTDGTKYLFNGYKWILYTI